MNVRSTVNDEKRQSLTRVVRVFVSILVALLVIQAYNLGFAQERSEVLTKIEAGVKETQPTWKLLKKNSTKDGQYVAYEWKAGKSSINLLLVFVASKDAASELIKVLHIDYEVAGLSMKFAETQLQMGDEAKPWEHSFDRRYSGIMLRKGKVVANISGTNKEDISRFAAKLAELLPPQ
jgi:hypothetical protein